MKIAITKFLVVICNLIPAYKVIAQSNNADFPNSPFSKAEIEALSKTVKHTTDSAFLFFKTNQKEIDAVMGDDFAKNILESAILTDKILPYVPTPAANPDWAQVAQDVKPYGAFGREIYLRAKLIHCYNQKKWPEFVTAADSYWTEFPKNVVAVDMNNRAWALFEHVNDKKLLKIALKWSEQVCSQTDAGYNENFNDTRANLLYKLGRRNEAIVVEQHALDYVKKNNLNAAQFDATLQKMKTGQPTWPVAK